MKYLKGVNRNGRMLFISSTLILLSTIVFLKFFRIYNQLELRHNIPLNILFVNLTFLGDSLFAGSLAFYHFVKGRRQDAFRFLLLIIITMLVVQLVKNIASGSFISVFMERSQYLFSYDSMNLFVNRQDLPSSHTAMSFSLAVIMATIYKRSSYQICFFVLACLVGFSRLYLNGGSLLDVVLGAYLGIISALIHKFLESHFLGITGRLIKFQSGLNKKVKTGLPGMPENPILTGQHY